MADWAWWMIAVALTLGALVAALGAAFAIIIHFYYRVHFGQQIIRIFEERPLFIIPRGQPVPGAEDVAFPTQNNLQLRGSYLRAPGQRKGVILFGLEFGSNRWSASQYCAPLIEAGFDVFAYEPRNLGESDKDPGYEPLQWVTDRDLTDQRAALAYLKGRPDAPADGIGIFGISKGGSVGLAAASEDRWVRCVATDGAYAAYTTMVPYMKRWVSIYSDRKRVQALLPDWVYGSIGLACIAKSAANRQVRFLSIESAVRRMRQPLLMIHGGADTYIKPDMAETLYGKARSRPKALWVVAGAKHNQAAQIAGEEYHKRVVEFFEQHLAHREPDTSGPDSGPLAPLPTPPAPDSGVLVSGSPVGEESGRFATAGAK